VFHVASLVLHAANVLLLYSLTFRLFRTASSNAAAMSPRRLSVAAALATALFAVHPLRVEVVTWATCQPYALCALCYLLTIHAYLSATREAATTRARRAGYAASIVFCAAAVLSKGVAVSLIVVLLVLDLYPLRRLRFPLRGASPVFVEKLPYVLVIGIAVWMGMRATQSNAALTHLGIIDRLAISVYGLVFCLQKTLLPLQLSPYYPVPTDFNPFGLSFVVSAVVVIAITVVLVMLRRRWPAGLAAWACYVAVMIPVLGIVQHGSQLAADRYSYLACMPLFVLLAGMLVRFQTGRLVPMAVGCGVAAVALTALTWRQLAVWRDSGALWTHALSLDERSEFAHVNLGLHLHGELGDTQAAIAHYEKALTIDEANANAHNNLGAAYADEGRVAEAVPRYRKAIELDPTLPSAHTNLSLALIRLGEFREAEQVAREAIERERTAASHVGVRPGPEPFEALGIALFRQQRFAEAVAQFRELNTLHPEYAPGYHNLGSALASLNRMDEAVAAWERAVALEPVYVDARLFLGVAHARAGRADAARAQFEAVLRLAPDHPQAAQYLRSLGAGG
jgi:tetratricopeptide (TPR) repeat protein